MSQQEKDIFIKEGCNESLFFIDGKSISIAKVKELESAIPMEVRDAGIVKRKAKRDAELEGLRRAALIKKARIDAETPSELRQKLSVLRHKYTGVRLIDDKRGGWIFPPELVAVRNEDKNEEIRIEQKLERLEKEERDIKLQQDENIRKVEREKEDIANKTVAKEAQRLREQCLSNGVIGICQSSSQNNTQYVCGSNLLKAFENIFNKYCYVTDNYSISTTMEVRNNSGKTIKDVTFSCTQNAKSGTSLTTGTHTIYDIWHQNEAKAVSIKFSKHEQVQSMNCKAISWK